MTSLLVLSYVLAGLATWDGSPGEGGGTSASDTDLATYHAGARQAIAEVLEGREFHDLRGDWMSWWLEILEWIADGLRAVGGVFGALPRWLFWVLFGWMVLTLVAILAHMLYMLIGTLAGSFGARRSAEGAGVGGSRLFGIRDLDFASVYDQARRLLGEGDWSQATKYLYVAFILWLDHQGRIVFRGSKTNRDYLFELAEDSAYHGPLRRLTRQFESVVYGGEQATRVGCEEMARLVESFCREAAGAETI